MNYSLVIVEVLKRQHVFAQSCLEKLSQGIITVSEIPLISVPSNVEIPFWCQCDAFTLPCIDAQWNDHPLLCILYSDKHALVVKQCLPRLFLDESIPEWRDYRDWIKALIVTPCRHVKLIEIFVNAFPMLRVNVKNLLEEWIGYKDAAWQQLVKQCLFVLTEDNLALDVSLPEEITHALFWQQQHVSVPEEALLSLLDSTLTPRCHQVATVWLLSNFDRVLSTLGTALTHRIARRLFLASYSGQVLLSDLIHCPLQCLLLTWSLMGDEFNDLIQKSCSKVCLVESVSLSVSLKQILVGEIQRLQWTGILLLEKLLDPETTEKSHYFLVAIQVLVQDQLLKQNSLQPSFLTRFDALVQGLFDLDHNEIVTELLSLHIELVLSQNLNPLSILFMQQQLKMKPLLVLYYISLFRERILTQWVHTNRDYPIDYYGDLSLPVNLLLSFEQLQKEPWLDKVLVRACHLWPWWFDNLMLVYQAQFMGDRVETELTDSDLITRLLSSSKGHEVLELWQSLSRSLQFRLFLPIANHFSQSSYTLIEIASNPLKWCRQIPERWANEHLSLLLPCIRHFTIQSRVYFSQCAKRALKFNDLSQDDVQRFMLTQETGLLMRLLETVTPGNGQSAILRSYLHQAFIEQPKLCQILHTVGYSRDWLPLLVTSVPSMRIFKKPWHYLLLDVCLDFVSDLIRLDERLPKQWLFAIELATHLVCKYPISKSCTLAETALEQCSLWVKRRTRLDDPKLEEDIQITLIRITVKLIQKLPVQLGDVGLALLFDMNKCHLSPVVKSQIFQAIELLAAHQFGYESEFTKTF